MNQDTLREKKTLQSMKFNRFLLVRFIFAGIFFTNVFWLILSVVSSAQLGLLLSASILTLCALTIVEQMKVQANDSKSVVWFTRLFAGQIGVNLVATVTTIRSEWFDLTYRFVQTNADNITILRGILVVGSVLSMWALYRLHNIATNKDRAYKRVVKYENYIQKRG